MYKGSCPSGSVDAVSRGMQKPGFVRFGSFFQYSFKDTYLISPRRVSRRPFSSREAISIQTLPSGRPEDEMRYSSVKSSMLQGSGHYGRSLEKGHFPGSS